MTLFTNHHSTGSLLDFVKIGIVGIVSDLWNITTSIIWVVFSIHYKC